MLDFYFIYFKFFRILLFYALIKNNKNNKKVSMASEKSYESSRMSFATAKWSCSSSQACAVECQSRHLLWSKQAI
jgi:hypothetical protein